MSMTFDDPYDNALRSLAQRLLPHRVTLPYRIHQIDKVSEWCATYLEHDPTLPALEDVDEIDPDYLFRRGWIGILDWSDDQTVTFYFARANDALAFKLRWV